MLLPQIKLRDGAELYYDARNGPRCSVRAGAMAAFGRQCAVSPSNSLSSCTIIAHGTQRALAHRYSVAQWR